LRPILIVRDPFIKTIMKCLENVKQRKSVGRTSSYIPKILLYFATETLLFIFTVPKNVGYCVLFRQQQWSIRTRSISWPQDYIEVGLITQFVIDSM